MPEEQSIQVEAMLGFSGPVRCSARGRARIKHWWPVFECNVMHCFFFFFVPPCLRVSNESDDRWNREDVGNDMTKRPISRMR